MKVLIYDDAERAVVSAADQLVAVLETKPDAVFGLATGGTMLPLYQRLVELHRDGRASFGKASTFNLDEYIGIAPDHACSYHTYMREVLFKHIDIDPSRTHLPRGDCADCVAEAARYEALIAASGGIDFQLVGIGQNGHIGFNEPTSSLSSLTRIKTLTEDTRRANARYFDNPEDIPKYALTMGVGSILATRRCLLLATGVTKARAVAAMVEGPISAACPASALQLHPKATIVLDRDAAAELELTEYYQHVHPKGAESVWN
ncbi:glucosamine-6-phosphate deaminase [Roseibium marinum]|uniref:Glucosamine-6-phosphate deaminase n=1 Tax=Roseibium marinum TaxID=281252 RepID=A0A2S3UKD7_9HYPH|nr:glucosamine-6-phosphate deaminase [Roseibium marinum]POF27959.1 glucosamine-6-phosphate deaminase [Roseibium marinum]